MLRICFLTLFACAMVVHSAPSDADSFLSSALKILRDCGDKPLVICLKERALYYIDQHDGDVRVLDGIQLIKTDSGSSGRALHDIVLPADPEARENEIDSLLVDRVARFFGSHTLQFKVPKESIEEMQKSLEEARGKKKEKKKYLLPLLMLIKLKAVALLPLAIGFIALIALKALVIGKIALLLSGIIGLKKLLEAKQSSQSYEVVAHPHYSHSSSSYDEAGGHYARSIDAHDLAYSAHTN